MKSNRECGFLCLMVRCASFSQPESLDDSTVAIDVALFEISQQAAALAHELCQRTRGDEVLVVGFDMLREVGDAIGEQGNLGFCRASVGGSLAVLAENLGLLF